MKTVVVYEPIELVDMVRNVLAQESGDRALVIHALAKRIGVTPRYVQQMGMLADAPDDLLLLVRQGTISATLLYELGMHYAYHWTSIRRHVTKALQQTASLTGPKRGRVTLAALNAVRDK